MHHTNKGKHIFRAIAFGISFLVLFSLLVFLLWNWLMPAIFGLPTITVFQAFGLLLFSKILFFGFHKRVGPPSYKAREYWRKRFEEEHNAAGENLGEEKI